MAKRRRTRDIADASSSSREDTTNCRPRLSVLPSEGEKDRSKENKASPVIGLKCPMDFCPDVFQKGGSPCVWQDFLEAHQVFSSRNLCLNISYVYLLTLVLSLSLSRSLFDVTHNRKSERKTTCRYSRSSSSCVSTSRFCSCNEKRARRIGSRRR